MFRSGLLTGSAACALLATQAVAQVQPLATDAAAFGVRDAATAMDLSPDGKRVVYVSPGPGRVSVVLVGDLATGDVKGVLKSSGDPESISWCEFAKNDRLICRYTAIVPDSNLLIGHSRLISLKIDGTELKELGQRKSAYDSRYRQFDGSVIDWLPGDPDNVLMTRNFIPEAGKMDTNVVRTRDGLGVVKVNVRTLKADIVERPSTSAGGYMADGTGKVRLMAIPEVTPEGRQTGRIRYQYRTADSREWQILIDNQEDEFQPLAIDGAIDSLYALRKLDGRWALYRIKLDDSRSATLVASNPTVDIDDVITVGDGVKIVGYTYVDDRRRRVYFDDGLKKLSGSLSKALPNLPLIDFVGVSADNNKLLLFAGSDNDPGRYLLFDRTTRALGEVVHARPDVATRTLATTRSATYSASDGTKIPAYVTLPPGSSGKGLPTVILPHGGPEARDEWGFDWLVQFLAVRGYAVVQPNFRGSGGYGDKWLVENGFRSWETSIGDVTAAARWVSSQGIADPNRTAILGWSYGGYAALQSAALNPSLYKSVIAIAPVTDLQMLKDDYEHFTIRNVVAKYVGSGPHVAAGSPLRRATAINAPVLLVHGDFDQNVGVAHSRKMNDALKSAGKPVDYVEFKGLDHQLRDNDARREMLTRIGELLDRTIGH
ncbi:MAG TPA: S9 family peptidase [Sphingomicrobium sp.]|nr:S9 family peptidase [Sphingomicrobium sp.]